MGNQKVLEEVGFPHIFKEKNLEKKFNKFVWALSVAALICAGIEAAVNFGFASVVPSTSYLRIVIYSYNLVAFCDYFSPSSGQVHKLVHRDNPNLLAYNLPPIRPALETPSPEGPLLLIPTLPARLAIPAPTRPNQAANLPPIHPPQQTPPQTPLSKSKINHLHNRRGHRFHTARRRGNDYGFSVGCFLDVSGNGGVDAEDGHPSVGEEVWDDEGF